MIGYCAKSRVKNMVMQKLLNCKRGSLKSESFVRFNKIFTANESIILSEIGLLKQEKFNIIINSIVKLLSG